MPLLASKSHLAFFDFFFRSTWMCSIFLYKVEIQIQDDYNLLQTR